jgi:hypothetical protein
LVKLMLVIMGMVVGASITVSTFFYLDPCAEKTDYGTSIAAALTGASKMVVAERAVIHEITHTKAPALMDKSVVKVIWMEDQRFFVDFGNRDSWSVTIDANRKLTLMAPPIQAFAPGAIRTETMKLIVEDASWMQGDHKHLNETMPMLSDHSRRRILETLNDKKKMAMIEDTARTSLREFIAELSTRFGLAFSDIEITFSGFGKSPVPVIRTTDDAERYKAPGVYQ